MDVYNSIPGPIIIGLVIFLFHMILILDCGAGQDIFFSFICRTFKFQGYRPSPEFARFKSKYLTDGIAE